MADKKRPMSPSWTPAKATHNKGRAPPPPTRQQQAAKLSQQVYHFTRPGEVTVRPDHQYMVLLVGGRLGGKTAFVDYFLNRSFKPGPYISTSSVVTRTLGEFPLGEETVAIEFREVGSSCPDYNNEAEVLMGLADVILFFFSVSDKRNFGRLNHLIELALVTKQPHTALGMVGSATGENVEVNQPMAEQLARAFQAAIPVKMVSAAMGTNMDATLVEALLDAQAGKPVASQAEEHPRGCGCFRCQHCVMS